METQELEPKLGRCEVTGNMVPEDELVTINGQRVCAEGKAILLDRLKAGETLPGEFETPTVGRRFGCILLDGLILGIPFGILSAIVRSPGNTALAAVVSLVATAVQVIYFGQMHLSSGRTVGKMAGRLKVVNADGSSPLTFNKAYIRALAYCGPSFLSGLALLINTPAAVALAGGVVAIYGLANVLFALFDRNMQLALHDRIAGTRVIYTA